MQYQTKQKISKTHKICISICDILRAHARWCKFESSNFSSLSIVSPYTAVRSSGSSDVFRLFRLIPACKRMSSQGLGMLRVQLAILFMKALDDTSQWLELDRWPTEFKRWPRISTTHRIKLTAMTTAASASSWQNMSRWNSDELGGSMWIWKQSCQSCLRERQRLDWSRVLRKSSTCEKPPRTVPEPVLTIQSSWL